MLITIDSEEEIISLIKKNPGTETPYFILGGGSNILLTRDFEGAIIHPVIKDIRVEEKTNDHIIISSGCGVKWDDLVEWCVSKGYAGLENLSFIPGLTGASPVQNIGAYGVEAKDTIYKVRAINLSDGSITEFSNEECRFGYRYSIFKDELKGKFLITKVYFNLSLFPVLNTEYGALNTEAMRLGGLNLKNLRQAVINIRRSKLPDPEILGNAGSFFKNPVVDNLLADRLKTRFNNLPLYPEIQGKKKIAAGWLIEQCGWKGKRIGDAGVHENQALVLVNYGKATGQNLFNLSEEIKQSVFEKFGILLDREVEIL